MELRIPERQDLGS